jgi:hypothetical protein
MGTFLYDTHHIRKMNAFEWRMAKLSVVKVTSQRRYIVIPVASLPGHTSSATAVDFNRMFPYPWRYVKSVQSDMRKRRPALSQIFLSPFL